MTKLISTGVDVEGTGQRLLSSRLLWPGWHGTWPRITASSPITHT